MCSAAWLFREGGYEMVFNRDEKWTRPASFDCRFETQHRVPGFCARDPAAHGTWLFTNQAGITLALLNAYPVDTLPVVGKRTRGQIALFAGQADSESALIRYLNACHYEDYAPFELLFLAESGVRRFAWDGSAFAELAMDPLPFLTSSSVHSERVIAARKSRFERIRHLPLLDILSDTEAMQPADAIYVTRQDGGTVSQTMIRVTRSKVEFSVTRRCQPRRIHSVVRKAALEFKG